MGLCFEAAEPLDLLGLAVDVAAVLRLDRHLLDRARASPQVGQRRVERDEVGPGRRRAAQDLVERLAARPGSTASSSASVVDPRLAGLEPRPAGVVDQADAPAQLGQAAVGVVVPQQQPVLGRDW